LRFTNIAAANIFGYKMRSIMLFAKEPFSTLFTSKLLEKNGLG
jgi:hypothetical protein